MKQKKKQFLLKLNTKLSCNSFIWISSSLLPFLALIQCWIHFLVLFCGLAQFYFEFLALTSTFIQISLALLCDVWVISLFICPFSCRCCHLSVLHQNPPFLPSSSVGLSVPAAPVGNTLRLFCSFFCLCTSCIFQLINRKPSNQQKCKG